MSKSERKRRRLLLQKLKNDERSAFENSLPVSKTDIRALFDYLERNLNACDDSLHYTNEFIKERNLPLEKTVLWLKEQGGFCDCEVLANVEDTWEQMIVE